MSIENRYPALANKVAEAREAGYQDEEIESYLAEREQTALEEGYKQEDVDAFLGRVENQSTGVLDDVGRMFGMGLNQVAGAFGGVVEQAGKVTGLESIEGAGKWIQDKTDSRTEELSGQLSWEQKQAREKKFTRNEEGERAWGEAWKDPRAYLGLVSESAPGTIVGIATGGVLTRAASKVAPWLGRTGAAALGYGAGEGAMAGTMAGKQVVDEIHNTPWETLVQTEEFRKAYHSIEDESMTHEDKMVFARSKLETAAYGEAAGKTGIVTTILSAPTGIAFDRMLRGAGLGKAAKPKATDILKYTAGEGLQEAPQGGSEEYISGTTLQKYADPSINPMDNVLEAAVSEGIAGVAMGAPTGVATHATGRSRYKQVKNRIGQLESEIFSPAGEVNPDVTPDTVSEYLGLTGVSTELWNEAGRPVLSPYARNIEPEAAPESEQPEVTPEAPASDVQKQQAPELSREKLQQRIANIEKTPLKNRTTKQLENLTQYQDQLESMEESNDLSGVQEPGAQAREEMQAVRPQGQEPITRNDGTPFTSEAAAKRALASKGLEAEPEGAESGQEVAPSQPPDAGVMAGSEMEQTTEPTPAPSGVNGAIEAGQSQRSESATPDFEEMVKEAARWRGAALNHASSLDKKGKYQVSKRTTKGDLDAYLMRKYGIDETEARDVSNALTQRNVEDDRTADPADYEGEEWQQIGNSVVPRQQDSANEYDIKPVQGGFGESYEIVMRKKPTALPKADVAIEAGQSQRSESAKQPWEMTRQEYYNHIREVESPGASNRRPKPDWDAVQERVGFDLVGKGMEVAPTSKAMLSKGFTAEQEEAIKAELSRQGFSTDKYRIRNREEQQIPAGMGLRARSKDVFPTSPEHERAIRQALADGHAVSPDVLAEYPELQPGTVASEQQDTAANTVQNDLPAERRSFIEGKVSELGSIEAVDRQYSDDTPVDRYARDYAREVFEAEQDPGTGGMTLTEARNMLIELQTQFDSQRVGDDRTRSKIENVKKVIKELEAGEVESKPAQETKAAETAAQEGKPAAESRADQETPQQESTPAEEPPTSDYPRIDREKAVKAYTGTHRNPEGVAKMEQEQLERFVDELREEMQKDLPEGRENDLERELERVGEEFAKRRNAVFNVREGTVSGFIAGRSNFNSKQTERRNNALDKAEQRFADWLKEVPKEVAAATGVAKVRTQKALQERKAKEQARKENEANRKEQRRAEVKLPIINTRGDGYREMTKAEWNRAPKDYKSVEVDREGGYRYRSIMVNDGGKTTTSPVFITDMKVKEAPEVAPAPEASEEAPQQEQFPVINDPATAYQGHMTKAEWESLGADRQLLRRGDGYMYRAVERNGSVQPVYITDMEEVLPPGAQPKATQTETPREKLQDIDKSPLSRSFADSIMLLEDMSLSRKPTVKQVFPTAKDSKVYIDESGDYPNSVSNGNMLDMNGRDAALKGLGVTEKNLTEQSWGYSTNFARVIPSSDDKFNAVPMEPVAGIATKSGSPDELILESTDEKSGEPLHIAIQEPVYRYFKSKYKDMEAKAVSEKKPVQFYSDGELVGFAMPMSGNGLVPHIDKYLEEHGKFYKKVDKDLADAVKNADSGNLSVGIDGTFTVKNGTAIIDNMTGEVVLAPTDLADGAYQIAGQYARLHAYPENVREADPEATAFDVGDTIDDKIKEARKKDSFVRAIVTSEGASKKAKSQGFVFGDFGVTKDVNKVIHIPTGLAVTPRYGKKLSMPELQRQAYRLSLVPVKYNADFGADAKENTAWKEAITPIIQELASGQKNARPFTGELRPEGWPTLAERMGTARPDAQEAQGTATEALTWEEAKKSIKWEKGDGGVDLARFTDPEEGATMNYGKVLDTHKAEDRTAADRYRTSDGQTFEKKAEAKQHELNTHARQRLAEDGYIAKDQGVTAQSDTTAEAQKQTEAPDELMERAKRLKNEASVPGGNQPELRDAIKSGDRERLAAAMKEDGELLEDNGGVVNEEKTEFNFDMRETATSEDVSRARNLLRGRGRRGGPQSTLLGKAITRSLKAKGGVSLLGRKVSQAKDLAALAQVYRNPEYETFRLFFTKGGEIVGQTAVSSRLPGVAPLFAGKPTKENTEQKLQELREQQDNIGADGFWLLHNHPSGNVEESRPDVNATAMFAQNLRGFQGHVIINHNKYSVLSAAAGYGGELTIKSRIEHETFTEKDELLTPEKPHPLLGRLVKNPEEVAAAAAELKTEDGYFSLFSHNKAGIRGIMEIPVDAINSRARLAATVRKFARQTGGQDVFAVLPNNAPDALVLLAQKGVAHSFLRDVVNMDGDSLGMSKGVSQSMDKYFGQELKGQTVAEGGGKYSRRKPGPVESRLFDTQEHKAWYSAVQGAFSRGNFSKEKIAEILDNANTAVLDRLNPVKKNLGEHVYRLHRLMGNSHATMQTFLEHGELSWKDQALTVLTKDKGFLPWLERLGDDAQRLFKWMAVRRAATLDRQGRENWLTADQRKALLDELFEGLTPEQRRAKVARFEQLNQEFQKWNKNIIKIAREAGLMSEEQIEAWTSDYYLPFYRIMENEMTGEEFMRAPRKAKQHVSAQIRRLKGGKEKLGDPIENIMRNWSHLIQTSQANVARQAAADVAVDIGVAEEVSKAELTNILGAHTTQQWAVRGAGNTRATKIFDDPATAEVYRETMEGRTGRTYEVVEQKNTTVQFGNQRDFSIVSYQDNGETVYLRVNDPDLFEAMSEVNIKAFESTTMKIMGLSKRVLTVGATATAGFRIANLFRDTIHTAMVSKSFIPFLDSAKGLAEVWNKSDAYIELMASGGGFSQGWVDSGDPKAMARAMEKIVKRKGEGSKGIILDTPRKMWEFWERIGHASEMAARVQLYKNLKAKGQSHMDAAFEARDLMDFQRSGASTSVRVLTATVPFLNARFQGLNRMYRGAKADPKAFWTKGAITAGASLMLWSLFKDDERYKELEDWEKFAYHHFWIGEQHFRLPKAFETGALFSTMFEAGADVMSGNEEFGYFVDFLTHTTTETFAIGMPQLISPVMEIYSNKSAFTGRDIESMALQRLPSGERAHPWTPEMLKDFGRLTGISPVKAEAIIRGYTAAIGGAFLTVGDAMYRHATGATARPAATVNDMPGIGRFVRDGVNHTKYATRYYDFAREVNEVVAVVSNYKRVGEVEMARKLATESMDSYKYKRFVSRVNSQLAKLTRLKKIIWADKSMTREEKRVKMDEIQKSENEIYQKAYRVIYEQEEK